MFSVILVRRDTSCTKPLLVALSIKFWHKVLVKITYYVARFFLRVTMKFLQDSIKQGAPFFTIFGAQPCAGRSR